MTRWFATAGLAVLVLAGCSRAPAATNASAVRTPDDELVHCLVSPEEVAEIFGRSTEVELEHWQIEKI